MKETKSFMPPVNDYIFKRVFGLEKHLRVLISLLKAILGLQDDDFESVELLNTHVTGENADLKESILDVLVRLTNRRIINVEMQSAPEEYMAERFVTYGGKLMADHLHKGERYGIITQIVSILITDFVWRKKTKKCHGLYRLYDAEQNDIITDFYELHTLETPKLEDEEGNLLGHWMAFFKVKTWEELAMLKEKDLDPVVREAIEILEQLNQDSKVRQIYDSRLRAKVDQKTREAVAEKRGQRLQATDTAIMMLLDGKPIPEVAKYNKLTEAEVEKLKESL